MNKFLLTLFFLIIFIYNVFANPNIQARTGILIDYHSDEILFELDPDAHKLSSFNDKNYDCNCCF